MGYKLIDYFTNVVYTDNYKEHYMTPKTFTYYDNDTRVKAIVIENVKRWNVEIWDIDTDWKIGSKSFKSLEDAQAYALNCLNK